MMYHWFEESSRKQILGNNTQKEKNPNNDGTFIVNEVEDNKRFMRLLRNHRKDIKSVIWCGKMPFNLKLVCVCLKIRFWDESVYKTSSFLSIQSNICICSLIQIVGNRKLVDNISTNLKNLFFQDGYSCVCISDKKYSYLRGNLYLPINEQSCKAVCQMYQPSVIVINSENMFDDLKNDIVKAYGETARL